MPRRSSPEQKGGKQGDAPPEAAQSPLEPHGVPILGYHQGDPRQDRHGDVQRDRLDPQPVSFGGKAPRQRSPLQREPCPTALVQNRVKEQGRQTHRHSPKAPIGKQPLSLSGSWRLAPAKTGSTNPPTGSTRRRKPGAVPIARPDGASRRADRGAKVEGHRAL